MIERRSLGSMRWAALWFVAVFSAGACEDSGGTDSNTNWLDACTKDTDCGTLGCLCGQCSKPCATAADCSEFLGATCRDNTTRGGSCATTAGGSCAKTCSTNEDCGRSDLDCRGGYCAPRQDASFEDVGAGGAGGASASAGGQNAGGRAPTGDGAPEAAGVLDGGADAAGRDSSSDGSHVEDGRIVDRTGDGSADASRDGGIVSDAGGDTSSVQIPVDGTGILDFGFPTRHSRTDADGIRVAGNVRAGSGVVRVSVNSVPADSLEGAFDRWRTSADVPLHAGRNDLRVVAERDHGPPLTITGFVWRVAGDDLSPFGDGPVVGPFRSTLVLGATLGDGRLAAFGANGAAVLDPDTGRRVPFPPNDAGTPNTIGVASDPTTNDLFVFENDGLTQLSSDLSSARLIGGATPGPLAYDPASHTVYVYADNIYAVDATTGTSRVVSPNPGGLCVSSFYISVLPGRNTLFTHGEPGGPVCMSPFIGRNFTVDIATGAATASSSTLLVASRDGRLLSFDGSGVSVVDSGTSVSTPLGGRGYSLTGGQGSVLVVDPHRDRLWVTPGADGNVYFAIDPFNGDRVLVSN